MAVSERNSTAHTRETLITELTTIRAAAAGVEREGSYTTVRPLCPNSAATCAHLTM